ncbi:TonB-dependent receptor [Altererythrobacter marinus]|uniref:TonB-dependent receptor n=1 Tax=Pelagerythrobacter marinus TaxID=538382 RepID=A0ABW9UWX8_9SPHN|nr:TonB-dependent receptor [Pelagerythrobacter marinus]MXO69346.1 TonB-dependent receptor [Pelagerythrobacter marinus]
MTKFESRNPFTQTRLARRLAAALAIGVAGGAMSVALVAPAHAQESTASLRGQVTGAQGISQVTAVEVNTGVRRTVAAGAGGNYNFASLRPGTYRLEVTTADGVRTTDSFTLRVAQNAVLDFDLGPQQAGAGQPPAGAPAGGNEIVVVADRIRTMEGGEVGANISLRQIETLPQNNRNFLAFADLAPGVQFVTGANGQSRLQGGAQDSRTVNIFIDGVGQKDYVLKNGVTGQDSTQGNPFPQMAIGEYRVISSNYKAEFDQVSSVAITAVTRSGTNEFHGQGFIDYTDQSMRAATPLELYGSNPGKVETKDFQFGGALGGPIIKDVMHFFVTYEGKRQERPVEITPGLALPVSFFPAEYQDEFGPTNSTFNEDLYFGKIDFVPSNSDLFEVSAKYRDESGEFLGSGINARSTISSQDVEELRLTGRWEHTTDNWINDLKLTYEDVKWAPTPVEFSNASLFAYAGPSPTDPQPGEVVRDNLLRIGGGGNYQDKGQKGWAIQNDFTWTGFEGHTIKLGVKSKWVELNTLELNNFNPVYTYNVAYNPGGGTFNDTIPYRVQFGAQTGTGSPIVNSKNWQFGIYAQDDWEVTDRLTLNIGVRWDYEETPAFFDFVHPQDAVEAVSPENYPNLVNANYDINDYISTGTERKAFTGAIQPRLGFTYELDEDGRFALFGGYGRSYDRNQFDFLQQEISVGSYTTRTFNFITGDPNNTCDPSPTCVPWDPVYLTEEGRQQLLAQAGTGGGRELRFIDNDLKMPYSDQFSLGLRGRLTSNFDAEVGFSHIESKDGFAYLLGNRRPDGSFFEPAPAAPNSPWGFAPAGYGSIIIGTNGLETSADSAYLKLNKNYTPASPWSLSATYTYTEAEENRNFGEVFALDFPSLEDYPVTRSSGVRKHRLVMTGSVDLPIDMVLSGKFQIASPPYLKSFISTGGPNPSRDVIANEANANGDRWGFRQMDLAVTKYLSLPFVTDETRIWIRADVINLFNDRNYVDYNADPASPDYLTISGLGVGGNPPRTIKVSAGFEF